MIKPIRMAKRMVSRVRRRFAKPCAVLMYHHVAKVEVDPWDLCVTPKNFAAQLQVLSAYCDVVPLAGLRERLASSQASKPVVAITFDDGYVDNLLAAKPLLEKAGMPATVFVATGQLDSDREFWWDELDQLLLHDRPLPPGVELTIGGRSGHWELTDRNEAYLSIWSQMQPLAPAEQIATLDALAEALGTTAIRRDSHRTLTSSGLKELAAGGLIEIGAHTINHPRLTSYGTQAQQREMVESKTKLESVLGRSISSFAYPFGDHDRGTVRVAGEAGFALACTTEERLVSRRDNPLAIPRFAVGNWGGEAFFAWMREQRLLRKASGRMPASGTRTESAVS